MLRRRDVIASLVTAISLTPSLVHARTFTNTASISIPSSGAATPYPSTITVPGSMTSVTRITVALHGFQHTWPDDVDILLVGPEGQAVVLMSDCGSSYDAFDLTLTFADNWPSLPHLSALESGTFLPTDDDDDVYDSDAFPAPAPAEPYDSALAVFEGTTPAGVWSLYVFDDLGGDSGAIAGGWSLEIVARAISYQGRLQDNGVPASGPHAMRFKLFDGPTSPPGQQVGPTLAFDGLGGNPPAVNIVDGLFSVDLAFGEGAFSGSDRWLEIEVDGVTLAPRQALSAAPHAAYADHVPWGGISNVPGDGKFWHLGGNADTDPNSQFIGTTDAQPLELRVSGLRVMRLSYSAAYWPQQGSTIFSRNVLTGSDDNAITTGVGGATISGGGSPGLPNRVTDIAGTVAGGMGNIAGNDDPNLGNGGGAFVGGGVANQASGRCSAVGGGISNVASGTFSTVGGGYNNAAAGFAGTVAGGSDNSADGQYSVVPGGFVNQAGGDYSFAGGYYASVRNAAEVGGGDLNGDQGTFVWADASTGTAFASTGPNHFLIRAAGGVGIGTNAPDDLLHVYGGDSGATPDGGARVVIEDNAAHFVHMLAPAANDTGILFGDPGLAIRGAIVSTSTDALQLRSGGNTTRATIDAAGRIGVGTAAPSTTLHVATGSDASLASGSGYLLLGSTAGENIVMDNDEIMARNNGAAASLYLNNDGGNVVIGPTTGYSTLHVESTAGSSGFRVRFDNNTKLIVNDNGSTSIGSGTLAPTNGLRVAGDCTVIGTLTKGGGSFKIDHPLDPENYYLYHSFVESPDMMNIYNGNVVTDAEGLAVVELPAWFEALNRDFRYQLTVLDESDDEFVFAKVYRRIAGGRFTIKTSAPGVEVSWQVTGIRKDAWAERNRIPLEAPKEAENRGRYLHAEAFGLGPDYSMESSPEPDAAASPVVETVRDESASAKQR